MALRLLSRLGTTVAGQLTRSAVVCASPASSSVVSASVAAVGSRLVGRVPLVSLWGAGPLSRGLHSISLTPASRFRPTVNPSLTAFAAPSRSLAWVPSKRFAVSPSSSTTASVLSMPSTSLPMIPTAVAVGAVAGVAALTWAGIQGVGAAHESSVQWPSYARDRIHGTFGHFATSLGIAAGTAILAFRRGFFITSWVGAIGAGLGTVGCAIAAQTLDPAKDGAMKTLAFVGFSVLQGLTLGYVGLIGGEIVKQAALATAVIMGSMSMVAAASPDEKFLWMGGPLAIGLGCICAASLGRIFFPHIGWLAGISTYGGVAVFSGLTLYDSSRIISRAKNNKKFDPMRESISMVLNAINIFVRMVEILAGRKNRK